MDWKNFNIYETYILKNVNLLLPNKRKPTYTNKYYLDNFNAVLSDVTKWKILSKMNIYKPKENNKKDFHWKAIENKFKQWTKFDIFKIAFNEFMIDNEKNLFGTENKDQLNMIIDVIKISNSLGSENVGVNGEYTKKNVTELSFITIGKIPLGVHPIEINKDKCIEDVKNKYKKYNERTISKKIKKVEIIKNERLKDIEKMRNVKINKILKQKSDKVNKINLNNKNINERKNTIEILFLEEQIRINKIYDKKQNECFLKNGKKITDLFEIKIKKNKIIDNYATIKKTFKHEISGIQPTLNEIPINFKTIKEINLTGDLAYKSKMKYYLNDINVNLIVPQRSNQKVPTSEKNKEILKDRYLIENFFANIKKYNRIYLRKDKKIKNFMSFVYMGLLEIVANIIDK